jgi:exodeoxyribonuclease V beta subunit
MSGPMLDPPTVLALPLNGMQLIEASAGTGKTYTIANLYLRHVVDGRDVAELLVVTFTVAATDELRGRIRARLFETLALLEHESYTDDSFLAGLVLRLRDQGLTEQTARRLRLAVRAMDEAAIYTIHGFCQRVLSEFAFNSGQQFRLEVLADDGDLWHRAIQDWWRRTGYPLNPVQARLFRDSLGDLEAFEALVTPLLGVQHKRLLPEVDGWDRLLTRWDALAVELEVLAGRWRRDGVSLQQVVRESKGLSRARTSPYQSDRLDQTLALLDGYFAEAERMPPPDGFEVLTAQCLQRFALKKTDPALVDGFFQRCSELWVRFCALKRDLRAAALTDAAAFAREQVRQAKFIAQVLAYDDLLAEMYQALHGGNGTELAEAVRRRFPVAMIDEFQDTDPVQYGIFRELYRDSPDCGLIMIGDPKQAIYSFRGGDIFTYMQAREDVGDAGVYTLGINWRSTPQVVNAVNAVFEQRAAHAFVYGETIPFMAIRAADKRPPDLTRGGERQAALQLWVLPEGRNAKGGPKPLPKDEARALSHAAVAQEIARLLAEGRAGTARLGDQALRPRDIAVLVRTSFEAAGLRQMLAEHGVNAVSVGRDSVFNSPESDALEVLLAAVLDPRERELARVALTCALLDLDYTQIERIIQSEAQWVDWVDQLLLLHQSWQRKGFMSMFQQLLRRLGIAEAIGRGEQGERRLTNLLHLGELLQQASKAHPGMDALLGWYRAQRNRRATEEAELRLESDEALVQIATIHASKGLEYPVVFVPYLWGCKPRALNGLLEFHRGKEACLDAGSDDIEAHLLLAEQERLAEDVRLAYVALTRAQTALYLVWGRAGSRDGSAGQTALAWLLHPHQPRERLAAERPDAFAGLAELEPDLQRLAERAQGDIVVTPLPPSGVAIAAPPEESPEALAPRRFAGPMAIDWRINSFSALTRDVHSGPAIARAGAADDPALQFPAGSHVGSYLHRLLECLDFRGDIERQVLQHSAQVAARFNLDHERWGASAAAWLARVIATPLDAQGLRLAQLPLQARLNELEFDFSTQRVDIPSLNALLEEAAGQPLPPLEVATFRGMVTGIIDLVFEYEGRFYIADYKSNFLGGQFSDYERPQLEGTVYERRYDLQYLLYTLALHRYLRQRVNRYDYARHFGGVYYLFLRGMRPESGTTCGIYFVRPVTALVEALDRRIFRPEEAGVI